MKRLSIVACLAAIAIAFVGCQSMALKSDDANERMKAVKAITEQEELLEVARNKDYKNDVRLNALQRLIKQRGIWRVWCENGENKEIADKALDLLTEEDLLARVALLHSYEESAEEKEERESSEKKRSMVFGAAALAVNAGGAAVASKANDAGGKAAADVGAKAANVGLAMAFSEQKAPEPNMAIRTNEALVAVGKLKTLPAISAVALNSTIESVQLKALRKLLHATKDVQTLKEVAQEGCLRDAKVTGYRNLDGDGKDISRQNKIIAIRLIQDSAALTNVIDRGYGETQKYAFARLIQMKDFDVAAEMLCKYDIGTFLAVEDNRDISDMNGAKLVARFPEVRQCEALALRAKSDSVGKAAVGRIDDAKILSQIINYARSMAVFKAAANRVSDQHVLEEVIMAGGERSDYAISVLKDDAFALELYNKADKLGAKISLARKIAQGDITADLCEKETAKEVKAVLLERASDEVKAELAKRRAEKIKKAIAVAEKDGKELLALIATKKSDQIDNAKIANHFNGRLLLFRNNVEMWNNDINGYTPKEAGRRGCLIKLSAKAMTFVCFYLYFNSGHVGIKERYSLGDSVSVAGIVNAQHHSPFTLDGDILGKEDVLGKVTQIFDIWDPDEIALNRMLQETDKSPTVRYAESVGWEFDPESVTDAKQDSPKSAIGKAVSAIGDVVDAVKEAKELKDQATSKLKEGGSRISDAWEKGKKKTSDMIKEGMKDALKKVKPSSSGGDLDSLLDSLDK